MVKVCDAIMGSGKSQSAIAYINEHPEKKFVYITPYLDEADRIAEGCQDANFIKPTNQLKEFNHSKLEHTKHLLRHGKNISTTHAAFISYTEDMIENISKHKYTLICDEVIDVLQEVEEAQCCDIQVILDAGYLVLEDGIYRLGDKEYPGGLLNKLFKLMACNNIMQGKSHGKGVDMFYWLLPDAVLRAFSDVFVLTYLFDGQDFQWFLEKNGIEYEYIGIRRDETGYHFSDSMEYTPEYVASLKDKIHILDNEKMNQIGDGAHDLSKNWYTRKPEEHKRLKNNVSNFFRHIHADKKSKVRMWGTYKEDVKKVSGDGYKNSHLPFNARATNDYRDRNVLSYLVNVFQSPGKKYILKMDGYEYDEDKYALSTMVQWIWRSAIRDGEEIYLYVPSRRMRTLLQNWIEEVSGQRIERELVT